MPELFKLLARNVVLGVVAGWTILALFLVTDTGGLGHVVFESSEPLFAIALLAAAFAITFGSLSMGVAIMTLPYEEDDGKGTGLKVYTLFASLRAMIPHFGGNKAPVPIPVKDEIRRSSYRR